MTFDDDMIQFEMDGGTRRITCNALKLSWPPPEVIDLLGFPMYRVSYSSLTDEQRKQMTRVVRGATYSPNKPEET